MNIIGLLNIMTEKPLSSIFKPGILFLLVLSGITAVILAGGLDHSIRILIYTLLFGMLAAGAANMLNNYVDRDIDKVMDRTKGRPIPAGRLSPKTALYIGLALGIMAVLLFWFFINPLASGLALSGILYYVMVYSMFLKARTSQNIVIGGFAAMFPPAVGWAAVAGSLAVTPLLLGLLVVFWTPPHFWALALVYKHDYKKAKIPMLPTIASEAETKAQILIYSVATVILSIFLFFYASLGLLYLVFAVGLGIPLVLLSLNLNRGNKKESAGRLFGYSIMFLVVLFIIVIIDHLI
jgi:protoheme IX farnesyltransferase